MVEVAVKVTEVPAQIAVALAEILMVGAAAVTTVMVIVLDNAVAVVKQAALLVITTLTTSPLASAEDVNVAELVPALLPFTFH